MMVSRRLSTRLRTDLEATITRWAEKHCEDDDWPQLVWGEETDRCIANAACAVLDAMIESQQFARDEGLLQD